MQFTGFVRAVKRIGGRRKMEKIYIVTDGVYPDYHICAVFSIRKKAKQYVMKMPGLTVNNIEERQLDLGGVSIKNRKPYFLRMDKKGNVSDIHIDTSTYSENGTCGFDINKDMHLYCWAKDEKHAIKIAGEKRRYLLANNK